MSTPAESVFSPAATGGSTLGDVLSGFAGAPVNRPALGAQIANGQALAGLRSAQTEEALTKAQQAREEAQASDQLEDAYIKNGATPSQAHLAAVISKSHFGTAQQAMEALKIGQEVNNRTILGDPTQLGAPSQTAAQQGIQGKIAEPVAVPNAYTVPAGQPNPQVQLSPIGEADVKEKGALAGAANTRAANGTNPFAGDPELAGRVAQFVMLNPASASNLRSLVSQGGAQVVDQWLTQNGFPRQGPPPAPPAAAPAAPPPLAPGQVEPNAPQHTTPNGITPAPGVSLNEQAAIRKDFAGGVGAKQATSIETAIQHAQLLGDLSKSLSSGSFVPSNRIINWWQKNTGEAAPTNFNEVAQFLGREAVRATVNSGAGTGEERELQVNANSSPDQIQGLGRTIRALLGAQFHSLDLRARRGGVDIAQLAPDAAIAYRDAHTAPAPAAAAAPGSTGGSDLAALAAAELARRGGAQ